MNLTVPLRAHLPDIKPVSPVSGFDRSAFDRETPQFPIELVAPAVGMSATFIRRVIGRKSALTPRDVLVLLDQDTYGETFVPRSRVLAYLEAECVQSGLSSGGEPEADCRSTELLRSDALDAIRALPSETVQCVVTSTPYWAMRIYDDPSSRQWADGDVCAYGHEQTPDAFVRHSVELLVALSRVITPDGSIWWNIMDTFNTRTQIRGSAVEALKAMQGKDKRRWSQHDCRRYSAGHSYLKDGEQCMIPSQIATRASKAGLYVKSVITWAKTSTLPEPQETRVSRNLEYIIHFSKQRSPYFDKSAYLRWPPLLGGRNNGSETAKLSDVWILPTSSGRDGHGAQFPLALPGRCIAISTRRDDVVLDPFVGSGNTGVVAKALGRRFIGIDVSDTYLEVARARIRAAKAHKEER